MKKLFYILPALFLIAGCSPSIKESSESSDIVIQDEPSFNVEEIIDNEQALEESEVENLEIDSKEAEDTPEQSEKEAKSFETLEDAVYFVNNSPEREYFKTSKPIGFERFVFPANEEAFDISPDGYSFPMYILTNLKPKGEGYEGGSMYDIKTFYIESNLPPACWPECDDTGTIEFYGPFKGELLQFLQ